MSAQAEQIKRTMERLGTLIRQSLPEGLDFVLVLRAPGGAVGQASNIHRPARVELLRELADQLDGGVGRT